jgi:hypothetical protein
MSFRAKCRIIRVESSLHPSQGDHRKVTLQPVYGGDDDAANKEWSKWTPSGQLELTITNPEVWPDLVIGRAFFVDFTPIEG